jgi:hypothetical protein
MYSEQDLIRGTSAHYGESGSPGSGVRLRPYIALIG